MYRVGDIATYSATDLSSHSECEHRSELELGVLFGTLQRPGQNELDREMLERRGSEHEKRVLEHYSSAGHQVETISAGVGEAERAKAAAATEDAMRRGAPVIYQGVLRRGEWFGKPDFLVRADGESDLGAFHYEPVDAKLASEMKGRAVLQLCVYADLLEQVQRRLPERIWIVPGGTHEPESLRFADFGAYYRRIKAQFGEFTNAGQASRTYPEPVEHCDVCPWWKRCEDRRRADDHPSLIAGITRRHRERFADENLKTLAAIGRLREGVTVPGIRSESLGRIRHQARIQLAGREAGRALHERLRPDEPMGLVVLPDPAPGDLFLDLEGDAFACGDGLEYLFGLYSPQIVEDYFGPPEVVAPERYHAFWATDRAAERRAFEAVVDAIVEQRKRYAGLHVYHFAHRENTAFKNLAARHGTRTDEIDTFLREGVLVDLHRITRQGIRASVESYTLKQLEPLHGFERKTPVRDAARAMQHFGWWLETGEAAHSPDDLRATIQRYNEEDCRSTAALRDWLWRERAELRKEMGAAFSRQKPSDPKKPSEKRAEILAQIASLQARLRAGLPDSPDHDTPEGAAKRLLADLLEWHARETKPAWWEYFRTLDVPADECHDDGVVLGELRFIRTRPSATHPRSVVDEYEFRPQEHGIKFGEAALDQATEAIAGTVDAIGVGFIHLRRGKNKKTEPARALIPPGPRDTAVLETSLRRLAGWVVEHGVSAAADSFRAARDVLMRHPPRIGVSDGAPLVHKGEDPSAAIRRLALALDASTLAVQGPPGSGKTTAAAAMIVELIKQGRRVGVSASSHKVILNLLRKAREEGRRAGLELRCLHIAKEDDFGAEPVDFELSKDYEKIAARLAAGDLDLVGGTAWAWSREDLAEKLDVLVVDEAGQLSLANVLAIAPAARNLILFGDPAQLEQPQKGVHPPASGCSALEHLLGDAMTMPPDLGVFMAHTRRLHPDICRFTSAVFYDGRLEAEPELATQRVLCDGPLGGSGLRFIPVSHRGNTNHSEEEVAHIGNLVQDFFRGGPEFVERTGKKRPMTVDDILIVAPYNVQVEKLQHRLPDYRHRIGTVDKFQGQEAPVVIYSMTTSSAEDAPRGMEFLFSLNRLNVATSRAKAVVVVVANPELMRAKCRTVRQMRLVNGVCAYLEMCRRHGCAGASTVSE